MVAVSIALICASALADPATRPRYPDYRLPAGPINICGEEVPLDIPDVKERLEREFIINVHDRGRIILWLKRSGRWFPLIERRLKEEGMPEDLKYVAIIESDLRVHAYSSAGAAGVWQFIRPTGRKYGLRRSRHLDERLKVSKATDSALTYLKKLHEEFGTWTLAMAAYNCGERRVAREIEEQGVKDYFRLDLPIETERYVFRAITAKLILEEPERHGFYVPQEERYRPRETEEVSLYVRMIVPVRHLAEACDTYYKHFKDLNPHLRGRYIYRGRYQLNVPRSKKDLFLKRMEDYFNGRAKWAKRFTYTVKRGDNLSVIARRYGTTVEKLKDWNRLRHTTVYPGQVLHIYPDGKKR